MEVARRSVFQGMAAATALSALVRPVLAQSPSPVPANRQRTLIKGGYVASLDSTIGEIGSGDVLIDGAVIAEVGRNINAPDAEVVDARVGWRVRVRCYFRGEPYNAGHCTGRSCATPLPNFGANTVRSTR